MKYKLFGNSGLRVSELCLGTMTFGTQGWGTDEKEAAKIYHSYKEKGGNFIDTANEVYGGGKSEQIVGHLIKPHREDIVLSSKYSLALPGGGNANAGGNHRKALRHSIEKSLNRLGTDYLDILWVHAWDQRTPLEETLRALDDLITQGKVLYLGISNTPAWVITRFNSLAEQHNWTKFSAIQAEYNLIERSIESDIIPASNHFDMSVLAWSPLASGILSGKYTSANNDEKRLDKTGLKEIDEKALNIAREVQKIADQLNRSPAQIALNWVRSKPNVIPLLGVRTFEQFSNNISCLDFELTTSQIDQLDALTAPVLSYPHDYLQKFEEIICGGFSSKTDKR